MKRANRDSLGRSSCSGIAGVANRYSRWSKMDRLALSISRSRRIQWCELDGRLPRNLHLLHKLRRHSHFASPLPFFNATTDLPYRPPRLPALGTHRPLASAFSFLPPFQITIPPSTLQFQTHNHFTDTFINDFQPKFPTSKSPDRPSSLHFFLLTTSLRPDPTTQVVGGVGSGLRPAVQSPVQPAGRGGGRGRHFGRLRDFACHAGCPPECLAGCHV